MTDQQSFEWHEPGEPEAKGWPDTERRYDRLPSRAHGLVPDVVWDLSRNSSGMFSRFRTNATTIAARWTVGSDRLAMTHMPATSVSGLDLYGEDATGKLRWVGVAQPGEQCESEAVIVEGLDGASRNYTVWFPLFNDLDKVEIGVNPGASFELCPPDTATKPVLYYGTSIIHGACASRSGMCLPPILTRRLGRTVINLGFSGNGKMEVELAHLIGEIDAAAYVLDCLPNMEADLIRERALPFIQALREARPETPIVLVEDRTYTNAWAIPAKQERHVQSRKAYREAFEAQKQSGDRHLVYVEGGQLLGDDDEGTVDSSHPTDLGFMRMADVLEPVLRGAIG
jgi:hypothetical protein